MDVSIKIPSGPMFLVICNLTIKYISYLILSYHNGIKELSHGKRIVFHRILDEGPFHIPFL